MVNEKQENYFFELFCIDPADIKSDVALAQALSFSNTLWGGSVPKLFNEKGRVRLDNKETGISIIISFVDTSNVVSSFFESAFLLKIFSQDFDNLEAFRLKILKHLKTTLQFNSIRLLTDDVSTFIANKLYPEINRVENFLRKYLIKFFIQRIGSDWWEVTANKTMIEKARMRRADRRDEISSYIDDELRFIDFDDLGELIYKQSSGYNNPDKIMTRLMNMNNPEEFQKIKNELQSNYSKYFKENFQDKNFEQKWKDIIKLRNKVAHQGIFYMHELNYGLDVLVSLAEIISTAEKKIDEIVFSIEDKQAIRDATIEAAQLKDEAYNGIKILGRIELSEPNYQPMGKYIDIDEEELLEELAELQKSKWNKFVGIKWFVTDYLANRNFNIPTTYAMLNILIDKGLVEKYDVPSYGGYNIVAIKVSDELKL